MGHSAHCRAAVEAGGRCPEEEMPPVPGGSSVAPGAEGAVGRARPMTPNAGSAVRLRNQAPGSGPRLWVGPTGKGRSRAATGTPRLALPLSRARCPQHTPTHVTRRAPLPLPVTKSKLSGVRGLPATAKGSGWFSLQSFPSETPTPLLALPNLLPNLLPKVQTQCVGGCAPPWSLSETSPSPPLSPGLVASGTHWRCAAWGHIAPVSASGPALPVSLGPWAPTMG